MSGLALNFNLNNSFPSRRFGVYHAFSTEPPAGGATSGAAQSLAKPKPSHAMLEDLCAGMEGFFRPGQLIQIEQDTILQFFRSLREQSPSYSTALRLKQILTKLVPIIKSQENLRQIDIATIFYGLRNLDSQTVPSEFLDTLEEKLRTCTKKFNALDISWCLGGLRKLDPSVVKPSLLLALDEKLDSATPFNSGDLGRALFGLKCLDKETIPPSLLEKFTMIVTNGKDFELQSVSNAVFGLQNLGKDCPSAEGLARALVGKLRPEQLVSNPMDASQIIYGLRLFSPDVFSDDFYAINFAPANTQSGSRLINSLLRSIQIFNWRHSGGRERFKLGELPSLAQQEASTCSNGSSENKALVELLEQAGWIHNKYIDGIEMDFYKEEHGIKSNLEIDGIAHRYHGAVDKERDLYLKEKHSINVLRLSETDAWLKYYLEPLLGSELIEKRSRWIGLLARVIKPDSLPEEAMQIFIEAIQSPRLAKLLSEEPKLLPHLLCTNPVYFQPAEVIKEETPPLTGEQARQRILERQKILRQALKELDINEEQLERLVAFSPHTLGIRTASEAQAAIRSRIKLGEENLEGKLSKVLGDIRLTRNQLKRWVNFADPLKFEESIKAVLQDIFADQKYRSNGRGKVAEAGRYWEMVKGSSPRWASLGIVAWAHKQFEQEEYGVPLPLFEYGNKAVHLKLRPRKVGIEWVSAVKK